MVTADQAEVIAFLESSAAHGGLRVERIDTHTAVVFLAGRRALKLKRAVRYDYLDYSTPDRRRAMCDAEVEVNRRTAPAIYRGVLPVVRDVSGRLHLGGEGTIVDWVVEMTRFDQRQLLDGLADGGLLPLAAMPELGRKVAAFHQAATRRPDHGGSAGIAWVIDGNATGFREFGGLLDQAACTRVIATTQDHFRQQRDLLDERRGMGYVRHCHGDLHLRNIVLIDGQPTLFDAVEFNDEIACVDVLYDLSFLLMDLWHRRLPIHANRVFNAYVGEATAPEGLRLLPLFQSCRAAIRAKTSATTATLQRGGARDRSIRLAGEYLTLAEGLLEPVPPALFALGGFSGSGKSTLALALAPGVGPAPGAVVLRSDEFRKRLFGVPTMQRLPPAAYTEAISATVYGALADTARLVLAAGHSVVVDAVFARADDRHAVEHVAEACRVPFTGLWLEAPEDALLARIRGRAADASDADEGVVRRQVAAGAGTVNWTRVDATRDPEQVAVAARGLATSGASIP